MQKYRRYAVFYCPPPGVFAAFGAAWLGWDSAGGCVRAHPEISGIDGTIGPITKRARKYGFHGTIKAPFRMAEGQNFNQLRAAFEDVCRQMTPVQLSGLEIAQIGGFLALVPNADGAGIEQLSAMAGRVVTMLDQFRAPLNEDERTRRKNLTGDQERNLREWGYPYVMDEFRFHMTLSGAIKRNRIAGIQDAISRELAPILPIPFVIDRLVLLGEAEDDGRFYALCAAPILGDNKSERWPD